MQCVYCGRETGNQYQQICSWECDIDQATKQGGRVIAPNRLPIRTIRADWTMLEHEHADHPDYKHPVEVVYSGPVDDKLREEYQLITGVPATTDQDIYDLYRESHALIYQDGSMALTLYEHQYFMWEIKKGTSLTPNKMWPRRLVSLELYNPRAYQEGMGLWDCPTKEANDAARRLLLGVP